MIIQSIGGLGKSRLASDILQDKDNLSVVFFKGHATPLKIYMTLYKNPSSLVVFDDVDALLDDKKNIALLKQLCEVTNDKIIQYGTTIKLNNEEVPESFISTNKVMILCNDFKRVGKNLHALESRGIYFKFTPSSKEILDTLKTFAKDKTIYDYLSLHCDEIQDFNFRIYIKCLELKKSGLDWVNYLNSEFKINYEEDLAKRIQFMPVDDRNRVWFEETGKSKRSLQRMLRKVKQGGTK